MMTTGIALTTRNAVRWNAEASVNDLMAALGSVGPWMLLEDLAPS